jgi:phosphatidylglycerophosphate synthase
MLDALVRRHVDPPLNRAGRWLAARGASADAVTLAGLILGLIAAATIAAGAPGWALLPLLASRLADGLDGAVARATRRSDFGGYFDITADFLFYGAVPLGFVLLDPAANAVAGAVLLLAFYFNGASFLGFAILAEKRGLETRAQGLKNLYYSGGLLEGSETIGFFVAICIWPGTFAWLALGFAALTFLTAGMRLRHARHAFRDPSLNHAP